jgi:hypothetical protein
MSEIKLTGYFDGLRGNFPRPQPLIQLDGKINQAAQDYLCGYCDGMHDHAFPNAKIEALEAACMRC